MTGQESGHRPHDGGVLGGPDRAAHEDELGGPDRAEGDELGGPDPAER